VNARPVTSFGELWAASGEHPMVRAEIPSDQPLDAVVLGNAIAFARPSHIRGIVLTLLGPEADARILLRDPQLAALLFRERPTGMLSVPARLRADVEEIFRAGPGGDWEWMSTTTPPPAQPAEDDLIEFDATAKEELDTYLAEHNSRTDGQPFRRDGQLWLGARDPAGHVIACGCSEPSAAGIPELSGITVASEQRGHGWGAAVTAALTRRAISEVGMCALGMYSDNDRAREIYHRLGFVTAQAFSSRVVARR